LLPPQLYPLVIGPQYEPRLMDVLPAMGIDAPSLEYVQHTSTTGAPGVVLEGQPKPELIFNVQKVIATAQKLAANTAASYEIIADWDTFYSYIQAELRRQTINAENNELINGDGTTGHLLGFLHTSGILTHAAVAAPVPPATSWDDLEQSITALRTGPALAEADVLVLNPATWSSIRWQKDQYGRYLASPDPSQDEVGSAWGCRVLPTTQIAAGAGLLIDSSKFGRVLVRETISMRIGWSGTDFVDNVLRTICEERLALAVERPPAVLSITGLPVS
jgi:HK97 family phage major capsid protein